MHRRKEQGSRRSERIARKRARRGQQEVRQSARLHRNLASEHAERTVVSPRRRFLNILTWNIFMMPAPENHENTARIEAIGDHLLANARSGRAADRYDILILQKAFVKRPRKALERRVEHLFPFLYGPANKALDGMNSGLWVLSKVELNVIDTIDFVASRGIETLARKGAMMLEGTFRGQRFQLVDTHLQGDGKPGHGGRSASRRSARAAATRRKQLAELAEKCVRKHRRRGVPQLICGDFSINRSDRSEYSFLLNTLKAEDGKEALLTSPTPAENAMARAWIERAEQKDYVLVRRNGGAISGEDVSRKLVMPRAPWRTRKGEPMRDLSYRYAILARVEFD